VTTDPLDDWEDSYDADGGDDDYEPEREPMPVFGCACENPLFIDGLCRACIAYLAEQDRLAQENQ
jgi:hypothetical protein